MAFISFLGMGGGGELSPHTNLSDGGRVGAPPEEGPGEPEDHSEGLLRVHLPALGCGMRPRSLPSGY